MDRISINPVSGWQPVRGTALVTLPAGRAFSCGERLELNGMITLPEDSPGFSYRAYLDRQGIQTIMEYPWLVKSPTKEMRTGAVLLCTVRQAANQVVVRILPQPESAILAGVVLGMEHDLPPELVEAFRATGTSHILVVSGFNVTLIAGLMLTFLSRRMSAYRAAPLAGLAVLLYTLLVGADPPVMRSAIMALLGLGGNLLGRRQAGLNSLTLAAAVMALFKPGLLADASFQLSFTATLGLIVYATPLQNTMRKWTDKIPIRWLRSGSGMLVEYLATTLAAQIATLPVIAYHFQRISLSSLVTNLLILPIQPLLMTLGGVAIMLGLLWLPLGQIFGLLTLPLAGFTVRVVEWAAGWSAPLAFGVSAWGALVMIVIMAGVTLHWIRFPNRRLRLAMTTLLAAGALIGGVAWRAAFTSPDGSLRLTVLDFPNASPVLIQSPAGKFILINSSADASTLTDHVGRRLPILDRSLAGVWIIDRRESNLTGLYDLAERYPLARVNWSSNAPRGVTTTRLVRWLAENGVDQSGYSTGELGVVDESLVVRVLLDRETQTVLLVEGGGIRILLPSGAPPELLLNLRGESLRGMDLLLLTSVDLERHTPPDWEVLLPAVVLISAPLPADSPPNWISTVDHGWLTATFNSGMLRLEGERP